MAKKPLSDTVCQRRLSKYIMDKYSKEVQDYIGYFNDIILEDTYSFIYELPSGENKRLTIDRTSGKIEEKEVKPYVKKSV